MPTSDLWLLGGAVLGGVLGYATQEKKNQAIGAIVGSGLGALGGMLARTQFAVASTVVPVAANVAGAAASAAVDAGSQAYQQALAPVQKDPSPTWAPTTKPTWAPTTQPTWAPAEPMTKGDSGTTEPASSIELLLDEAGFMEDDPSTYTGLLDLPLREMPEF